MELAKNKKLEQRYLSRLILFIFLFSLFISLQFEYKC